MARYEIWLTNDAGVRLTLLSPFFMQATRVANAIGRLQLDVAPDFDITWLKRDRIIQVWRAPEGGALSLFRPYFLRGWEWAMRGSHETLRLSGPDVNDLLRRRIVAYAATTSQADKTATEADDLMKDYVDENLVSATDTDRNYSLLSVEADATAGPQLNKSAAWRSLYRTLQDINEASYAAGTEVFFDIVPSSTTGTAITLQFRTRINQPGQDLTARGAMFSTDARNLEDPYYRVSYADEVNYVYGLGQGAGSDRNQQPSSDTSRINASTWNRCEAAANAYGEETDNGVREAARTALAAGRPMRRIGGRIVDTAAVRFGRDWNFGDRVRMYYKAQGDCIIRAVTLTLDDDGRETIDARLDAVLATWYTA